MTKSQRIEKEITKTKEQLATIQAKLKDLEEEKRMAERAEKLDIIEKHKISSEKLQLLIKFSEDEILKLLEEKENAKKDMGEMLDYIDQLNELDTTGVEPMSHVFPVNNVFREDVVVDHDGSADTLANAPAQKDGGFKVPKTIG